MTNCPSNSDDRLCVFIDNTHLFRIQQEVGVVSKERLRIDYKYLKTMLLGDKQEADVRFYYSEFVSDDEPEEFDADKKTKRSKIYRFLSYNLGFIMVRLRLRTHKLLCDSLGSFNVRCRAAIKQLVDHLRSEGIPNGEVLKITGQDEKWLESIDAGTYCEERGVDCEIVYDMVALAMRGHYDRFVLVSGSEEFCRTVQRLRSELGIPIDVAFFGSENRCSHRLRKAASRFIDLEGHPSLFRRISDTRTSAIS